MQVLTASQVSMLKAQAAASYDALVLVENAFCHTLDRVLVALTSDRAIATYKTVWAITRHAVMLSMAAAFYSGVLTRELWNRFSNWADGYVQSCEAQAYQSVEVSPVPVAQCPEPVTPILALPPAKPRRTNQCAVIEVCDRILITPAPTQQLNSVDTQPQGKRKRGRPRKVA